jgi:archaemetzincin
MKLRTARCLLLVAGLIFTILCPAHAQQRTPSDVALLQAVRADGLKIKDVGHTKGALQPHDWLESHPEPGQTFDEYLTTEPNRPGKLRTTIYFQSIGTFPLDQQRVIGRMKELLRIFYGLPTKELGGVPISVIPASAQRPGPLNGATQLLTPYLLEELLPSQRPRDAVAVLAVTNTDLSPEQGLSYVFGQAKLRDRVGVCSLRRYGDPAGNEEAFQKVLRRTLKVAVHETGHMFGIQHCKDYECGMNAPNHLDELDRNQLAFCPECEQKVWWSCRSDRRKRYQSLQQFARDNRLIDEERIWTKSLRKLNGN